MRAEVAAAERHKEVRDAGRSWRRASLVSDEASSRIASLYPDDRRRFGPGFRALAFIFTGVAAWAIIGLSFLFAASDRESGVAWMFFWAIVLTFLTEIQTGPLKRASAGAESATALMAVFFFILGVLLQTDSFAANTAMIVGFAAASASGSLAAWRWGGRLFFLSAAASVFGLFTQTDHGRLLWIVFSSLLIPASLLAARDSRRAPSHRKGAMIVGAVAILALYAALHIWSWDHRVIESLNLTSASTWHSQAPLPFRPVAILATALLPLIFLMMGWSRREPLLLYSGLLLTAVSIATLRLYHALLPLSIALILVGAVCLTLALSVRRWLRSGDKGERDGFTADPLFDNSNRTDAIRSVVAMASFTPAAETESARPTFEGRGGNFGGGGATGGF